MESIREIYRTGVGPSSSHTMGPRRAAELFREKNKNARSYRVTLYGSLASTGRGHLTDKAVTAVLENTDIRWKPGEKPPLHPNGMEFEALDGEGGVIDSWRVYSIGGGALRSEEEDFVPKHLYSEDSMADILELCDRTGASFWEYVEEREERDIRGFLEGVWRVMVDSVKRGLETEGVLPGGLGLARKAMSVHRKAVMTGPHFKRTGLLSAYALAAAEENASGGRIVTAPTCGSCGVLPSVLYYLKGKLKPAEKEILKSLAVAGLVGALIKHNASLSGAQVGCQGEIGAACSMAAAGAARLLGGTVRQIEYAAEMGLEHHLGLTCDPVKGLVQIPCIERNALAACRALTCADYALFSDGVHRISFDEAVSVMKETGNDLPSLYRETSSGGLARAYSRRKADDERRDD